MKSGFRAVVRLYSGFIWSCRAATPGFSIYQSGENFKMVATIKCPCMIEKCCRNIWKKIYIYIEREIKNELCWNMIEGSLEVKLPTICRKFDWTSRGGQSQRREKKREDQRRKRVRRSEERRCRCAHCVFPMICGSGGSKSRLAKAAGAEPAGQMRDEKLHAVVARSTFRSQNLQSTSASDHFWKLRCRKSARRCGAKHFWKSKGLGPLLEVEMSKKYTPLLREAHFKVKLYKTHHVQSTLEVEMSKKCTPLFVARSTFRSQNAKNTTCSCHFWTLKRHFVWQAQGILHPAKIARKWPKREGFVALPKTMAVCGFEEDLQRWSKMHFAWQAQYKRHVHQRC